MINFAPRIIDECISCGRTCAACCLKGWFNRGSRIREYNVMGSRLLVCEKCCKEDKLKRFFVEFMEEIKK